MPTPDRPPEGEPPTHGPGRAVGVVRDVLRRAGYTAAGIAAAGIDLGLGVRAADIPTLTRAVAPAEPLATLVRMFVLGEPVERPDLRRRLLDAADAIVAAGLARDDDGVIGPVVRLTPWRDLVVAHDPDPPGDLWPEHVAGPTPAAETLIRLVSPSGGSALDVGTGCGLLALAIARGQHEVVATDVNAAALRLTALNAALNDAHNVRVVPGSLFEPVVGETFDLVVSNPPFVISPESALVFRHSGFSRDEISRDVIAGAAAHLAPGGFAYLMVNWIQRPGDGWLDALRPWLEGTGCDALCLRHDIEDPLAYAVRWNARERSARPDRYADTLDRWLGHFRAERIEAIGSGVVVLRRRDGRNWIHGLELAGDTRGDAGSQVRAIFAGRDLLDGVGDGHRGNGPAAAGRFLDRAFRIPAGHRLIQSLAQRDGEYVVEPAAMVMDEGLTLETVIEPDLIPVVLRLDGTQTLGAVAAEIAAGTGEDVDRIGGRVIALVRMLVERGIAVPEGDPG